VDLRGFIEERKPSWRRLEDLLDRVDRTRFKLSAAEAQELGALYRRASADLCRAQARTANAELLRYLNDLVARGYALIYSGRKFRWGEIIEFFTDRFPAVFRARWRPIALAAAIMAAGFLFGFVAAWFDETAAHFLVPDQVRETVKNVQQLPQQFASRVIPPGQSAIMSSFIMANNIRVCFMAFAAGVTLGFGTAVALFYNGLLVGVLASYMHRAGFAVPFWAIILPHGVIELTAIFIAGGAGFVIGAALLNPGELGRRQALRRSGLDAVRLAMGTVPMLVVAGTIEGFVTPQGYIPDGAKLGFGLLTGIGLVAYFAPRGWIAGLLGR
jgi:uncharacterized membrane protein SpoIIM required for sporulation